MPLKGDMIDVFALGVMLFVALFGRPPFKTASRHDSFYKYFYDSNPKCQDLFFKYHPSLRGSHIDEDLKRLIKDLMNPNPMKRPSAREIL